MRSVATKKAVTGIAMWSSRLPLVRPCFWISWSFSVTLVCSPMYIVVPPGLISYCVSLRTSGFQFLDAGIHVSKLLFNELLAGAEVFHL